MTIEGVSSAQPFMGKKRKVRLTLLFFLQSLVGETVSVELRNETVITGIIENVDEHMGISMIRAYLQHPNRPQKQQYLETMYIHGTQIRYALIPDSVPDVETAMRRHATRLSDAKAIYSRKMKG